MIPAPMKTASAALSAAFQVEERVERLVAALREARAIVASIQHAADPEARRALEVIDAAISAESRP